MQTIIPSHLFENTFCLQFCIKTSLQNFIWYLRKSWNTDGNSSYKLSFGSSLVLFDACLFRTIKSHLRFLSVMRDVISLTSCSPLMADRFFVGVKYFLSINDYYHSFLHRRKQFSADSFPSLSHLTSCTSIKSNPFFCSSLSTVFFPTTLQRLFTFQVTHIINVE